MKIKLTFAVLFFLTATNLLIAQNKFKRNELLVIDSSKEGIVQFLKYNLNYKRENLKGATSLLKNVLQLNQEDELRLDQSIKDEM